jgi:ATP-dependent DNA helicase RecG
MNLATPVEKIPRIGPQYQKKLKKLGIKTVGDLFFHFPHRYEDFSNLIPVSGLKAGEINSIQGKILEIENTKTWKKRMILTQALIGDNSGAIKVIWFNQPYLLNVLKEGDFVSLSGKVALREGEIYLSSPAYEKISNLSLGETELTHTGRLVPVYPETEGLSSRWLRYILRPLLLKLKNKIPDPLPEKIREKYQLLPLQRALWQIHFPDSSKIAKAAQERFAFENLFLIELQVLKERQRIAQEKAIPIPINLEAIKSFVKSLPFKLTVAQKKSAWQILRDLKRTLPMNRLLEGDVGSGKTVVAAIGALNVAKAGFQVAFMAPAEILAKQHFQEISKFLKKFKIKVGLLTGKEKVKPEKVNVLIGTHALIQNKVKFKNLALVVVDEQHRFGVEQRAHLCQSSGRETKLIPHLLSMTATPIPRTLALTIYGDLDLSLIDEVPKGRKKVITKVIAPKKRKFAYNFIKKQVKQGRQVFVICPRIEKDEKNLAWAEVKAVKEEYQKLSKEIFPELKIAMLHGKMKTEEKEKVMKYFKNKKTDVLVSTSVVEVGIDVPNATMMMIEGAERFGLAQLHQFRGRVGRGKHQSFCFLFTDSPAKKTQKRLMALISSENGFKLAEKDLEIRGPGEIFGQRQWGIPDLAMNSLKDIFLVEKTRQAAKEILEKDPELKKYPFLQEKLKEFQKRIHLE